MGFQEVPQYHVISLLETRPPVASGRIPTGSSERPSSIQDIQLQAMSVILDCIVNYI